MKRFLISLACTLLLMFSLGQFYVAIERESVRKEKERREQAAIRAAVVREAASSLARKTGKHLFRGFVDGAKELLSKKKVRHDD